MYINDILFFFNIHVTTKCKLQHSIVHINVCITELKKNSQNWERERERKKVLHRYFYSVYFEIIHM